MSEPLHERARRMRQRVALRRWEYRQRRHAHGTWFRLRRVLADAERAFVASREQVDELLAEGLCAEPVGAELHPEKTIVFVTPERLRRLGPLQETPLLLEPALLNARHLLLVPFPELRGRGRSGAGAPRTTRSGEARADGETGSP